MNFLDTNQGDQVLNAYLRTLGKSSEKAYRAGIRAFFQFFDGDLTELTEADIIAYRDWLIQKKNNDATISRKISQVNGFLKFCAKKIRGFENPIRSGLTRQTVPYSESRLLRRSWQNSSGP